MRNCLIILCLFSIFLSCAPQRYIAKDHEFPKPVDTRDHPIEMQIHKTYHVNGVYADNEFEGARLNNFEAINDSTFKATIAPENFPINMSAYYGMRLRADRDRAITVQLHYTQHEHRYVPKISSDGIYWHALDSTRFDTLQGSNICAVKLDVGVRPLYLCAQEIKASPQIKQWCQEIAGHEDVRFSVVGKSKLGRDMYFIDISQGDLEKKPTIVIVSRQHPPEVTGYLAMEAFVEEILADNVLSRAFRAKYRIMVFPLMNPDGVDEGHWRHNAGGIDLNRDWSHYNQPETRTVADFVVSSIVEHNSEVILGLDFHSTQEDVFYTLPDHRRSMIYPFKDMWITGLEQSIGGDFDANDEPGDINSPITKFWFYLQFGAEGITYEVGDETPRDFIQTKGIAAAQEMMQLLVLK